VEHRDKGRLELNFLIPNTELLTGKRLQPYYDRADRPRIDAWQTIVNGRLGLHDPNAPENRRALVTPSALPEAKQEAAQAITRGLLALASSGELKTRQDVTEALESAGFEVVRTTKSSISIADPDGGRNIRLKGAIYEQSFNAGEGLRAEIESAAADYRRDAESRIQRAREVCQSGIERKREENQRRHPRPRPEAVLSHEPAHERHGAHGQPDVADHCPGVRVSDRLRRGHSLVAGAADTRQLHEHPGAEGSAGEAERTDVGRELPGRQPGALSGAAGRREGRHELDVRQRQEERHQTGAGVEQHDGAGKTVAERIRAATAGLLEKAGRVGERLRGMADDVWAYATGERGTERARYGLEQAGAEFERAAAPVVERLNAIEWQQQQEKEVQHRKSLEVEYSHKQRRHNGPTLG
ncbi:nuclease, partial [Escherichia coli]|nr:nuclease [Escherichia coli]